MSPLKKNLVWVIPLLFQGDVQNNLHIFDRHRWCLQKFLKQLDAWTTPVHGTRLSDSRVSGQLSSVMASGAANGSLMPFSIKSRRYTAAKPLHRVRHTRELHRNAPNKYSTALIQKQHAFMRPNRKVWIGTFLTRGS
jgi:hypothetical protein